MAGDWIKMRMDLQTHPKVVRILSALGADKFRVIGGLHSVWCVFDLHSVSGELHGYTPSAMDHIIGWPGFSDAMIAVGWLQWNGGQTLVMPEFSEHNGKSAKRRAEDQKRKRDDRKFVDCPQSVRNLSADEPDKDGNESGLEKRREEKIEEPTSSLRSDVAVMPTAKPPSSDDETVNGIVETWNAYADRNRGCKRTEVVTAKLRKKLLAANGEARKLVRQMGWAVKMRDFWTTYWLECESDPWMRGEVPNPNNPKWKQHLECLLDDKRFRQVMDLAIDKMRVAA